jgi:predicted nucleic-acid-binding protein
MRGIDTNVLVRFILRDDTRQAAQADRWMTRYCRADEPCLVNRIVLCELAWVLDSVYGYGRDQIAAVLAHLMLAAELLVESRAEARAALDAYRRGGADFADHLLGLTNRSAGCELTGTFDRKAARVEGFALIERD